MSVSPLNGEDALRQANVLIVNAALRYTRLKKNMRRACRMVLLEGVKQAEAARRCSVGRQDVNRALRAVKPKLAEVKSYVEEALK